MADKGMGKVEEEILLNPEVIARNYEKDDIGLTEEEISAFDDEYIPEEMKQRPWRTQTRAFYSTALMCAVSACIVGIDIALVSGATVFYVPLFNISSRTNVLGLVSSATLLGGTFGSLISSLLNTSVGRKKTLFVAAVLSTGAALWEALSPSWQMLLVGRLLLGVSMGLLTTTISLLLSEITPYILRGGAVSIYQLLITGGIFIGYVVDAIFVNVDTIGWRLMLGATLVPSVIVISGILFQCESPRWLIETGRYEEALTVLKKLRGEAMHAEHDFAVMKKAVEEEKALNKQINPYKELLTVASNRRALLICIMIMLFQQYSAVNVFMYYVDYMLVNLLHVTSKTSVEASVVTGFVDFLFTWPVFWIVERWGRRKSLLAGFPIMFLALVLALFSNYGSKNVKIGLFIVAIVIFLLGFAPALGPLPFVYSSEVFPLHLRSKAMGIIIFWYNVFDFVVAFTWPDMESSSMGLKGGYGFYGCCIVWGFIMVFLFVPETKGYTLEQSHLIFEHSFSEIASYHWKTGITSIRRFFGMSVNEIEKLCPYDKGLNVSHAKATERQIFHK
ncbi:MFS transporter, SP family, sugar:H+ symporter [Galdieria sulphuraria]|uniref:MFS transporter, SP family, sugar:H+ symporter n=1 Tax=Galdieria sulphuraria TaxID=130081 RepID=M2VV61_GALSU|nr:MFS transporter, SP family, sugar:H+ symporter [Galdieria sulphuraria]EME27101.1 MFS transporter, SP family, sugar:H+ symporter [Galdieria sulphuraria]|eukprot:XP_005703621.1 MFS transporter, SP family, sugar:H+ symporter [Galdieria sulphuraria]